jgi:hypothetical protein
MNRESLGHLRVVIAACGGFLFACGAGDASSNDEHRLAAASESVTVRHPSDPVTSSERIVLRMTLEDGLPDRLYVPVTKDGAAEHAILDSGTARTWFRLANATQDWTDNAFVSRIGDENLTILGRKVPPFTESVDGRVAVGALGIDFLSAGPTELDLHAGVLIRHPVGFEVPGSESWPVLRIQKTRGLIHGEATIDGQLRRLLIDTGAPTSILLAQPQPGDVPRTSHDVLGNPFTVWDGRGQVEIADHLGTSDVPLTRAPSFPHLTDTANAMGVELDGLLGLTSLGRGRVIFDLANGVLRFEPRQPG